MDGLAFIPGDGKIPEFPLGRFLPPLPGGILSSWLESNIPTGSWLLDPLGSSPQLSLEAARSGHRVLVACNNPIIALMIEVLTGAPQKADFQSAISSLADSRRSGERLEVHLQSLYKTTCPGCGNEIQVKAYLWNKEEAAPYARIVDCPSCGKSGEFPLEPSDSAALELPGNIQFLHSRALERIGIPYAAENPVVQEVVESYSDRAFYTLFNLINRIEALPVDEEKRKLLQALLLSVSDAGNKLWPQPAIKTRPRLITPPADFIEINLWAEFQKAIDAWTSPGREVEFTVYPQLPQGTSAICLFPGRLQALGKLPPEIQPSAALAVVPYPNQAFWSYSAVWAGWIWGKETAGALHGVLGRQRFDSRWVGAVLTSAFSRLPAHIPFYALIPEISPGLLLAGMAAGLAGGMKINGIACESESDLVQILWETGISNDIPMPLSLNRFCRDMMTDDLLERGEPATYMQLSGSSLERMIRMSIFPSGNPRKYDELLTRIQQAQKVVIEDPILLKAYGSRAADSQGLWWFQKLEESPLSLADKVEQEILLILNSGIKNTRKDVENKLNNTFRGFLTPAPSVVDAILDSYCFKVQDASDYLEPDPLREPSRFSAEISEIEKILPGLGNRLGYACEKDEIVIWKEDGKPAYRFFFIPDGRLSRWIDFFAIPRSSNVILCPECRQELIFFKIGRDPRLVEALGTWRLIGFDQLRRIASNNDPLWAFRDALSDPGKTPDGNPAQISFLS
jgi:hypothetical protein